MERAAVELLNTLRTTAFMPNGRTSMLATIDSVERLFQSLQQEVKTYHDDLAERDGKLAEALERLALSERKNALLEEQIRLEIARRFGKSREHWKPDEKLQARLFNEIEAAIREDAGDHPQDTDDDATKEKKRRKKERPSAAEKPGHGGRKPLPANLRRVEKIIDLPGNEKACATCNVPFIKIGEEASERLCIEPIKFYVERTVRITYASACGCAESGIHTAPVPNQVLPKSMASPSLLAQILASKFCDALPFNRQSKILKQREGIDISRATMARWALETHEQLEPMADVIWQAIRSCSVMNMDETRVRVLNEDEKKKEGLSWMWCAAARLPLERPTGKRQDIKLVAFRYAGTRSHEVAEELLDGFSGTLMSDAYAAYNGPTARAGIIHAACMAHVRRKYHDVLKIEPNNPKAQKALAFIAALYDVEREYADGPPERLLTARREKSRPIMKAFWEWTIDEARDVLPKSTLGKAINYTLPLWQRLEVYLDDAMVPIDNNIAENAIRPFAIGRKNWMFFDQADGADASTSYYTLIETARANDMEPMHYLRFLFNCIEHFGHESVPWKNLLPIPELRSYAESIGIPYSLG